MKITFLLLIVSFLVSFCVDGKNSVIDPLPSIEISDTQSDTQSSIVGENEEESFTQEENSVISEEGDEDGEESGVEENSDVVDENGEKECKEFKGKGNAFGLDKQNNHPFCR